MKTNLPTPQERASQRHASLSRRRFLRGLGVGLALPALDSLTPFRLLAAEAKAAGPLATTPTGAPLRTAFVYFPNGAHQGHWWPRGEGKEFQLAELNRTMKPLEKVKGQIQVLGELDH